MELVYKINGVNYVLFNCPFALRNKTGVDELYEKIDLYKGILQGAEKIDGGFWGDSYLKITVLIPEDKALIFSNTMK